MVEEDARGRRCEIVWSDGFGPPGVYCLVCGYGTGEPMDNADGGSEGIMACYCRVLGLVSGCN